MNVNSLFTFHNEFDDVDVSLDDDSNDIRVHGPFSVRQTHNDRAIGGPEDDTHEVFASLAEAKVQFLAMVEAEIDAVLSQG